MKTIKYVLTKIYEEKGSIYKKEVELPEKLGEELFNDFEERNNNDKQK